MDSIDKLLSELKAEFEQPKTQQQYATPPVAKLFIKSQPKSASLIDNLLSEVKADFSQRDAAEELQKQEEIEQEKIRLSQLKAQQLDALNNRAQDWLDKLDPLSLEGLWFEKFAEGHSSKLAAVIEYLQIS